MKLLLSILTLLSFVQHAHGQSNMTEVTTEEPMSTLMTTAYPDTTEIIEYTACDEPAWFLDVSFTATLIVDADTVRETIRTLLEEAFANTIEDLLGDWQAAYCFALPDSELVITQSGSSRRLLQTEYDISATFEYDDNLQDAVFGNDQVYNSAAFSAAFTTNIIDAFVYGGLVDESTTDLSMTVQDPIAYDTDGDDDDRDHKVEGALINFVSIVAICDILLFVACALHLYRNTYPRVKEEGDIPWKEASKTGKIPYPVFVVELITSLLFWIMAIFVVLEPSYLGWLLFCLCLAGEVVLFARCVIFKQLALYQIPKLKAEAKLAPGDLKEAVLARRTDVGVIGVLLATVQDIPVMLIVVLVGENFGYSGLEVFVLIFACLSVVMKVLLLGAARCIDEDMSPEEQKPEEKKPAATEKKTDKTEEKAHTAIELAEETKEKKGAEQETKPAENTQDVQEEEETAKQPEKEEKEAGDAKPETEEPAAKKEDKAAEDNAPDVKATDDEKPAEEEKPAEDEKPAEEAKPAEDDKPAEDKDAKKDGNEDQEKGDFVD